MFSICSADEILPASTYAGSPPTQLNRKKTSSTTPAIVGTICHSRRTMYPVMPSRPGAGAVAGARASLRGVDVDVLPFRMQDRMLLVPDHVWRDQHVAIAADVEAPRRVRLDHLGHLVI